MRRVKGFTLIELLIVVAILGILATFVILTLSSATKNTKNAKTRATIKTVQEAVSIVVADKTDLVTAFGFPPAASQRFILDSTTYSKVVDFEGKKLLGDVPLDAQKQQLHLAVTNGGEYRISGQSATPGLCFQFSTIDDQGFSDEKSLPTAAKCVSAP